MASTTPTQKDLEAAKTKLKDARFLQKNGNASEDDVKAAKREVDRIQSAIRRAAKSNGNGNGGGKSASERVKAQAARAKAAASSSGQSKVAKEPVKVEKKIKPRKDADSLTRTEKGEFHRVSRKNRALGVHISIYDLTLRPSGDRRFSGLKPENGRWLVVAEELGEAIQSPTWTGCGPLITDPTTWLSADGIAAAKAAKEATAEPVAA